MSDTRMTKPERESQLRVISEAMGKLLGSVEDNQPALEDVIADLGGLVSALDYTINFDWGHADPPQPRPEVPPTRILIARRPNPKVVDIQSLRCSYQEVAGADYVIVVPLPGSRVREARVLKAREGERLVEVTVR